jgi:hypothetical protein
MKILEIQKMPTTLTTPQMKAMIAEGCKGAHESTLRAFHIVNHIKYLLDIDTPAAVILDVLEIMEARAEGGVK